MNHDHPEWERAKAKVLEEFPKAECVRHLGKWAIRPLDEVPPGVMPIFLGSGEDEPSAWIDAWEKK